MPCLAFSTCSQHLKDDALHRILNDLKRTRLSCRRMFWLFPHPLSRQQVVSHSQSSRVSPVELANGIGGKGVGEEPNHTKAGKPGPLYIINTLWHPLLYFSSWISYFKRIAYVGGGARLRSVALSQSEFNIFKLRQDDNCPTRNTSCTNRRETVFSPVGSLRCGDKPLSSQLGYFSIDASVPWLKD